MRGRNPRSALKRIAREYDGGVSCLVTPNLPTTPNDSTLYKATDETNLPDR